MADCLFPDAFQRFGAYNEHMGLFASLFKAARPVTAPQQVEFHCDSVGYAFDPQSVGVTHITADISCDQGNVAIIGLNGSGKSTLIGLLNGELLPTSGHVFVSAEGKRFEAAHGGRSQIRAIVGTVQREADLDKLKHSVSVEESMIDLLKKYRLSTVQRRAITGDALAKFALEPCAHAPLDELDGEQLHLFAIARAYATNPGMLLADEPMRGLDEISSRHVAHRLFNCGKPVVFATHNVDLIRNDEFNITRVLVMDDGTIAFDGTPERASEFYAQLIRSKYRQISSTK